jgi:hypothetical protein
MKRIFIFALVMVSAVGLIVHCGGGGGSSRPDLAGTWEGTGWSALEPLMQPGSLEAVPQVVFPPCPTVDGYVTIDLVLDSDGNPSDFTICGDSIDDYMGTGVTGVVDQTNFGDNLIWFVFSETISGDELFEGSVVLDDSSDYAVIYFWESTKPFDDVFIGVLQRTTSRFSFSEKGMVGSWSGFTVDFEEDVDIFFEKFSPLDITLSVENSLALTGTDPDGFTLDGSLSMDDTDFGYVEGTIDIVGEELQFILDSGFPSLDGEFFGALIYSESFPDEWSVIGLRKQVVVE